MSLSSTFVSDFPKESWSLYATGILIICLRLGTQLWNQGRLRGDDYLMIFAACWYTLLCVSLNQIVGGGGSNFMSPADVAALTPQTTKDRIQGAKWVFVSEQSLMATIWAMKGCMLVIYGRLTTGLKQRRYINWLAIFTYVGYGVTEICYFSMCRPFSDYFAVPNPPGQDQCASYLNVLIVQGCFNVLSDIGMLVVGIPLLLMVQVPFQQKIGVVVIFGMGIFVIIAAIINKVYSTLPALLDDSINYTAWYMREATVGVYVINLPSLWPALRKVFPMITGRGSSANTSERNANISSRPWGSSRKRTQISSDINNDGFEMKSKGNDGYADSEGDSTGAVGRSRLNTSQERILENGHGNGNTGFNAEASQLEIKHNVTFTVEYSGEYSGDEKNSPPADSALDKNVIEEGYQAHVQAGNGNEKQ